MEEERIADAREVLMFLTDVLRGGDEQDKSVQVKMKAAELLGKRSGAFTEIVTAEKTVILDDISDTAE